MDARIDSAQLLSQATTPRKTKNLKGQNPEKLKEVTQQFESIFIQQIYKEMRKTIPNNGLIPRGNADEIYNQMLDLEAAKVTTRQGGIGMAELMMQQLTK